MNQRTGLMAGRRGLIMGVANDHSIAWGIARNLAAHGAGLAFTYQDEPLLKRVRPLAESVSDGPILLPCDVARDDAISAVFDGQHCYAAWNQSLRVYLVRFEAR